MLHLDHISRSSCILFIELTYSCLFSCTVSCYTWLMRFNLIPSHISPIVLMLKFFQLPMKISSRFDAIPLSNLQFACVTFNHVRHFVPVSSQTPSSSPHHWQCVNVWSKSRPKLNVWSIRICQPASGQLQLCCHDWGLCQCHLDQSAHAKQKALTMMLLTR